MDYIFLLISLLKNDFVKTNKIKFQKIVINICSQISYHYIVQIGSLKLTFDAEHNLKFQHELYGKINDKELARKILLVLIENSWIKMDKLKITMIKLNVVNEVSYLYKVHIGPLICSIDSEYILENEEDLFEKVFN